MNNPLKTWIDDFKIFNPDGFFCAKSIKNEIATKADKLYHLGVGADVMRTFICNSCLIRDMELLFISSKDEDQLRSQFDKLLTVIENIYKLQDHISNDKENEIRNIAIGHNSDNWWNIKYIEPLQLADLSFHTVIPFFDHPCGFVIQNKNDTKFFNIMKSCYRCRFKFLSELDKLLKTGNSPFLHYFMIIDVH